MNRLRNEMLVLGVFLILVLAIGTAFAARSIAKGGVETTLESTGSTDYAEYYSLCDKYDTLTVCKFY